VVFGTEPDGRLSVAMEDPTDLETIDFLTLKLGAPPRLYLATDEDLNQAFLLYQEETTQDFKKTIAAEKVILQIEKEICSIMAKMGGSTILDRFGAVEGVTEDEISDFVRETLFSGGLPCIMKPDDLDEKIGSFQKCDEQHAETVRKKMQSFGMKQMDGRVLSMYNLHTFALLRNYISPEENSKLQENKNVEELEKKFLEVYDVSKLMA
jgi:hypothetical protein